MLGDPENDLWHPVEEVHRDLGKDPKPDEDGIQAYRTQLVEFWNTRSGQNI